MSVLPARYRLLARGRNLAWALSPVAPLVTVVHSAGTVPGILHLPDGFRVTEKAGAEG